jgi:hypothetical protein
LLVVAHSEDEGIGPFVIVIGDLSRPSKKFARQTKPFVGGYVKTVGSRSREKV